MAAISLLNDMQLGTSINSGIAQGLGIKKGTFGHVMSKQATTYFTASR